MHSKKKLYFILSLIIYIVHLYLISSDLCKRKGEKRWSLLFLGNILYYTNFNSRRLLWRKNCIFIIGTSIRSECPIMVTNLNEIWALKLSFIERYVSVVTHRWWQRFPGTGSNGDVVTTESSHVELNYHKITLYLPIYLTKNICKYTK